MYDARDRSCRNDVAGGTKPLTTDACSETHLTHGALLHRLLFSAAPYSCSSPQKRPRGVESQAHTPSKLNPEPCFLEHNSPLHGWKSSTGSKQATIRKPGHNKPVDHNREGGQAENDATSVRSFNENSPLIQTPHSLQPIKNCERAMSRRKACRWQRPVTGLTDATLSPCKTIVVGVGVSTEQDRSIFRSDRVRSKRFLSWLVQRRGFSRGIHALPLSQFFAG